MANRKVRTLSRLRADAAPEDRSRPELAPPSDPVPSPRSRYIRPEFKATTLDQLRERCGAYGDAAVHEAEHGAVCAWLMKTGGEGSGALMDYGNAERWRLSVPSAKRRPWPMGLLAYGAEERARITQTARQAAERWRAAGSPGLLRHIQMTQQYFHSLGIFADERRKARERIEEILSPKEGE